MAASQADIDRVRLCLAIPPGKEDVFNDDLLAGFIEGYPVRDTAGLEPEDTGWAATYDLNAATAELWSLIAVNLSNLYDFNADGAQFNRSQLFTQARAMQRHFNSRRRARSVSISKDDARDILYTAHWPWADAPPDATLLDADLNAYHELDHKAYR